MAESPTVAVTGAAGYAGSRVVKTLQKRHPNWDIVALDNFYRGEVEAIGDVTVDHVDVRNRDSLESTLDGATAVLHLAAISGVEDCDEHPDLAYEVNVHGTENVAWYCRKTGTALAFPVSMAAIGDPQQFPITATHPRDPVNWYGRTKVLGERAIDVFAGGAFPAHQFLISNLYGAHEIDGRAISKTMVIDFFVDRARAGEPLTVYEPGTQARNFVHVKDVARLLVDSAEFLVEDQATHRTGARTMTVGTEDSVSVMAIAELVQEHAEQDIDIELVENPRSGETLVEEFTVDASQARETLGWSPQESVEATIAELLG